MSKNNQPFYITTPIYYPSGKPHIGHAYSTILADVICRYKKLIGYDAFMQTGMDEHGQKIQDAATKNNKTPQQFVDEISLIFKDLWDKLDINYSSFIRTSDPKHTKVVQQIFKQFQDDGYIYLSTWSGLYCVSCEENYTSSQAVKHEDGQLYCAVGHKLTQKNEPSYFFKMSEFQTWIKQLYNDQPNLITPNIRVKELLNSFVNDGLHDLSVSRTSITWGIPVLHDEKHKIYVWIDALLNYLTGLGYLSKDDSLYQRYWNNKNGEVVHVMSKEITRFHCIYWPIMLNCLKLRQPTKIISHGWIVTKEGKMSKSFGNVIDPIEYIKNYGSDALRYFLMKEITIEKDGIFSNDLFEECFNADLANNFGNLISRTIGMIKKYAPNGVKKSSLDMNNLSISLLNKTIETIDATVDCINSFNINYLLANLVNLTTAANKYIEDTKPWELNKQNKKDEIDNFLFCLLNVCRTIAVLLAPVLTKGSKLMIEQLNLNQQQADFDQLTNFDLISNHKVNESKPIYERLTKK